MGSLLSAVGLKSEILSSRFRLIAIGGVVAVLFGCLALAFLGVAAYTALLLRFHPWLAALIVAGVASLVAIVAFVATMRLANKLVAQVNVAVKSSAVALVAPTALRVAGRNVKLTVGIAAAGALLALWRARSAAAQKH